MTNDLHLTKRIRLLLENRRFFVELIRKSSRWGIQKNGLPEDSVRGPVLFNTYTNDQPISPTTRRLPTLTTLTLQLRTAM